MTLSTPSLCARLGVFLAVSLLSACSSMSEQDEAVYVSGNEIIYNDDITPESNERFYALVKQYGDKIDTITITSKGGDINLGMDLGEFIFTHQLDVKVESECLSSCANYVFPSGKKKLLAKNAVVGFHGGASSTEFDMSYINELDKAEQEKVMNMFADYIVTARNREQGFFDKIGVDSRLVTLGQEPQYDKLAARGYLGWYYDLPSLATFGVDNITLIDGDWFYQQLNPQMALFEIKLDPSSLKLQMR